MRENFWFVIEGDNGTGKDTLADQLRLDDWFLVNRTPNAVTAKEQASRLTGLDRVEAFMSYNQTYAHLASVHPVRSILIRYWPSTLAAGFADSILDWTEFKTRAHQSMRALPVPKLMLFLQCGLTARRNRVQQRGIVSGSVDDTSEIRSVRYQTAITWLAECVGPKDWKTMETTTLSAEQVHEAVRSLLSGVEGEL